MAYRRPKQLTYRWMPTAGSKKSKTRRIRMPQSPYRPLRIRGRDAVKARGEWQVPRPGGLVIHRRGKRTRTEGVDLESRAKHGLRGTLPERVFYKALEGRYFVANVDFDFQSSMDGGRLELGGILADFIFWHRRLVVQVQGPTHEYYLRFRKDEEQRDVLTDKGFSVLEIDDDDVLDQPTLDAWLRRNLDVSRGGVGATYRTL